MRQFVLVGGAFALTLAVLVGGFLVLRALPPGAAAPTASPSPSASPTQVAAATSTVSPSPTWTPTPAPSGTATPVPSASESAVPTPSITPVPSFVGGEAIVVTVRGQDYVLAQGLVPTHATITKLSNGGIRLDADGSLADPLLVTYRASVPLPAGKSIKRIDVKVCGSGSGDFYESYGPPGSVPVEYEFEPPAADGCWHYAGAPGPDSKVIVAVNQAAINAPSTLQIDRLVYTFTVG
jgi:hypothetical protein